jgi:hypothetical protein
MTEYPKITSTMRVLVACEFSGAVRDAFLDRGIWAFSCDLSPSEGKYPKHHYQCDVRELFKGRVAHSMALEGQQPAWDLMIAHPPCTYLASSGARWWPKRQAEQKAALAFVKWLMDCPVPRIAIENPIGIISTRIMKPAQIIQPYQFGHPEWKSTCLWLKNLPLLKPTNVVQPDMHVGGGKRPGRISSRLHRLAPGPERQRERSRTYSGIANAMAAQWAITG